MQAMGKFLEYHLASLRKLVKILIISVFTVQVLVVFCQVVWRFVFNNPFSWSEELARYLQVWMILLTSAVCVRKEKHLAVDYATHALPSRYSKILKFIIMIFIMFFTCIVIIYGIQMIVVTINQKTPALQIPILVVYLAFPITGILMFLEALILFFKLGGVKNATDLETLRSNNVK